MAQLSTLPAEIRLMIYRLILIQPAPISMTVPTQTDAAILQTCRCFRDEGSPILLRENQFVCPNPTPAMIVRVQQRLGCNVDFFEQIELRWQLTGTNWQLQFLELVYGPQGLEATVHESLRRFRKLKTFSLLLAVPNKCHHRSQAEEVRCRFLQEAGRQVVQQMAYHLCLRWNFHIVFCEESYGDQLITVLLHRSDSDAE